MRAAQNATRTKSLCLETRHAGFDTEFFCDTIYRNDNSVAISSATNPNRTVCQIFSLIPRQRDLATGKKTVAIHM